MAAPTPKAIDSPAEPAVWTTLFSRMVAWRMPKARDNPRKIVIARTATGIEAETVMPTLRNRYSDEAPKTIPRSVPMTTAGQVSSGSSVSSGMYDWKAGDPPSPDSRVDSAPGIAGADMSVQTPFQFSVFGVQSRTRLDEPRGERR